MVRVSLKTASITDVGGEKSHRALDFSRNGCARIAVAADWSDRPMDMVAGWPWYRNGVR